LLVAVGLALGLAAAEAVYLSLASEPLDADGNRVDWETIRARILVGRR
jgi:hypothetical protein